MKMDFSFRISSDQCVSRAVIAEAVAMYVGGSFLHHRSEIELSGVAQYRVEPADDDQWSIHGASLTEKLNRLSLAHYLLMAGFFKANFSIEYFGANARLPNEVGIVTNRLYRYRIDERETLTNRDRSYLGEGRSKVYGHVQWIRYAGRYFEMRNKAMVEACLNQAERLSVTKVQLRKINRMRTEWKLFSLPSGPVRLLAMGAIPSRCGMTVYERIVAVEKTRLEAFEFSDYGRKTWNVTDVSYAESTPNKLMDAGFNEGVFELLTGQSAPQILPEGIPQLFSFDADNRRVWGHNHTGRYFVEVQPNIVFGS